MVIAPTIENSSMNPSGAWAAALCVRQESFRVLRENVWHKPKISFHHLIGSLSTSLAQTLFRVVCHRKWGGCSFLLRVAVQASHRDRLLRNAAPHDAFSAPVYRMPDSAYRLHFNRTSMLHQRRWTVAHTTNTQQQCLTSVAPPHTAAPRRWRRTPARTAARGSRAQPPSETSRSAAAGCRACPRAPPAPSAPESCKPL
jgi:hypothetical protein